MVVETLDLKGELVTILNQSLKETDISGWILSSGVGDQTFTFPDKTILKPGASTNVWSGKDSDTKDHHPYSFGWTKRYIWKDSGDFAALYDSQGNLVHQKIEFPVKVPKTIPIPKKK